LSHIYCHLFNIQKEAKPRGSYQFYLLLIIDVTRDFRFGHDIITYTNIGRLCHIDVYLFLFLGGLMSNYKYLMNTGGIQYENKLNHSKTNIEMREECDKSGKDYWLLL
jgi:hypothetical protein